MTQEVKPETENRQPEPKPENFKPYFPCEQECPTCHTKWTADQPLPCPTCTNLLQENAQLRAQVEEWQTAAHQLYKNAASSSLLPVPEPEVQRDNNRCAICAWPLIEGDGLNPLGCVRGNCSLRPHPEKFYDFDRAVKEYGATFDTKYRVASLPVGESRWISVEEKLPEKFQDVLIWRYGFEGPGEKTWFAVVASLEDDNGSWLDWSSQDISASVVTHWQSLPQPPGPGESRSEKGEYFDLQLMEDALFMAAAVDANSDRAERMRELGERIYKLKPKLTKVGLGESREPLPGDVPKSSNETRNT